MLPPPQHQSWPVKKTRSKPLTLSSEHLLRVLRRGASNHLRGSRSLACTRCHALKNVSNVILGANHHPQGADHHHHPMKNHAHELGRELADSRRLMRLGNSLPISVVHYRHGKLGWLWFCDARIQYFELHPGLNIMN